MGFDPIWSFYNASPNDRVEIITKIPDFIINKALFGEWNLHCLSSRTIELTVKIVAIFVEQINQQRCEKIGRETGGERASTNAKLFFHSPQLYSSACRQEKLNSYPNNSTFPFLHPK
jgi:hypothetical protein